MKKKKSKKNKPNAKSNNGLERIISNYDILFISEKRLKDIDDKTNNLSVEELVERLDKENFPFEAIVLSYTVLKSNYHTLVKNKGKNYIFSIYENGEFLFKVEKVGDEVSASIGNRVVRTQEAKQEIKVLMSVSAAVMLSLALEIATSIKVKRKVKRVAKEKHPKNNICKKHSTERSFIDLDNPTIVYENKTTGDKNEYNYSVESFSRRGYYRRYKSGKVIWIAPTTVKTGKDGEDIKKEYKL